MYQPDTYAITLLCMLTSMLCWGSWANTVKLAPGYRFQLFYWDYVAGLLMGAVLWGVSLGSWGSTGLGFFADLRHCDARHILFATLAGIIFNVANLLLVAAIDIAGLAVAFPVGIGIALVVGAVSSYLVTPEGNAKLLFGGIVLVLAAIVCDALAYRERERQRSAMSRRGVVISVISGLLMGSFYPFVAKAMSGATAPGPYAVAFYFAIGVLICSVPFNALLMRRPLDGSAPVAMRGYFEAPFRWHFWGILGGAIWCTGAVLNFVASGLHFVGPAVSYSIGQGATMISAAWGVFVWHEFANAPRRSRMFLVWMFVLFLIGLGAVALAPII
ncbi:MAG TPA: GRP family sugar transporter [Bryobacteraceae bacterium]|jgi:glucose uptake protein